MAKTTKEDNFWKWLGDYLLAIFKKESVKLLFSKLFKTASMSGLRLWLVKFVVNAAWNFIGEPIAKYAIRKGLLFYDKVDGHVKVRKLQRARDENNQEDYDNARDDIFN